MAARRLRGDDIALGRLNGFGQCRWIGSLKPEAAIRQELSDIDDLSPSVHGGGALVDRSDESVTAP